MDLIRISAKIGETTCLISIGNGAKDLLAETLGEVLSSPLEKVAVVTEKNIMAEISIEPGISSETFFLPEGENAKNLQTVEKLCEDFSNFGLTRSDAIVALGGGLITDVAGFAAAIYHRGLPAVYIPTTLLAQVDAAIGGKTGVNLATGKNLVGAFHQPLAVLCDTQVLDTLPEREKKSGLGEIVKYHFIAHNLRGLEDYFKELKLDFLNPSQMLEMSLAEKIACCIAVKLFVVCRDEKDTGLRSLLNYGHTLGHSLEVAGKFNLRHGEAVALGLIYAAELAHILGRIDEDRVSYHREIVESYGLPVSLKDNQNEIDPNELLNLMGRDKKARGNFTFVLEGPDGMDPAVEVPEQAILQALKKIN